MKWSTTCFTRVVLPTPVCKQEESVYTDMLVTACMMIRKWMLMITTMVTLVTMMTMVTMEMIMTSVRKVNVLIDGEEVNTHIVMKVMRMLMMN